MFALSPQITSHFVICTFHGGYIILLMINCFFSKEKSRERSEALNGRPKIRYDFKSERGNNIGGDCGGVAVPFCPFCQNFSLRK